MIIRLLKYAAVLALVVGVVFALLNLSYLSKQIGYYFNHTFVSENQRQAKRDENPVSLVANQLYIPSLDIKAPIVFVSDPAESVIQPALQHGVVHYPNTARIGQEGNCYIFGHSSDFAFSKGDYKTVFAILPKIEIGAQIQATNEDGKLYTYTVTEKFVAEKTQLELLSQETNHKSILTLQTSYPIGTALKRYIVKAELNP